MTNYYTTVFDTFEASFTLIVIISTDLRDSLAFPILRSFLPVIVNSDQLLYRVCGIYHVLRLVALALSLLEGALVVQLRRVFAILSLFVFIKVRLCCIFASGR